MLMTRSSNSMAISICLSRKAACARDISRSAVSEPERAAFRALQDLGLIDSFRLFEQPERVFSWWDYRMLAFRRNFGLRIDHLLVSPALREACRSCTVDKEPRRLERPSDHAPVVLELDMGA